MQKNDNVVRNIPSVDSSLGIELYECCVLSCILQLIDGWMLNLLWIILNENVRYPLYK